MCTDKRTKDGQTLQGGQAYYLRFIVNVLDAN
jgi:hypothetical protein